jgi:transposase
VRLTGGGIKCGDIMMRKMLFEAALVLMTHNRKWSWLKAGALRSRSRRELMP